MKSAVKQNQRQGKKPEPQMPAHPCLCTAKPPGRYALPGSERSSEQHEREANNSEQQPQCASTGRSFWSCERIRNVNRDANNENRNRNDKPRALGGVEPHFTFHPRWITSWKN